MAVKKKLKKDTNDVQVNLDPNVDEDDIVDTDVDDTDVDDTDVEDTDVDPTDEDTQDVDSSDDEEDNTPEKAPKDKPVVDVTVDTGVEGSKSVKVRVIRGIDTQFLVGNTLLDPIAFDDVIRLPDYIANHLAERNIVRLV